MKYFPLFVKFLYKYRQSFEYYLAKKLPYFAVQLINTRCNQFKPTITHSFQRKAYEAVNLHLKKILFQTFIIVDSSHKWVLYTYPFFRNRSYLELLNLMPVKKIKHWDLRQIWNVLTELGADRKSLVINWWWCCYWFRCFLLLQHSAWSWFYSHSYYAYYLWLMSVGGKNGVGLGI
jgi:hypothetical protein